MNDAKNIKNQKSLAVSKKNVIRDNQKLPATIRFLILTHILRTITDKDHPLKTTEIAKCYVDLLANSPFEIETDSLSSLRKTIHNELIDYANICATLENESSNHSNNSKSKKASDSNDIINTLIFLLGGQIKHSTGVPTKSVTKRSHEPIGKDHYFYFEANVIPGVIDTLSGAIFADRYLSEVEKCYLDQLVKSINSFDYNKAVIQQENIQKLRLKKYEDITALDLAPEEASLAPAVNLESKKSGARLLKNVKILMDGINNGCKVEIEYGRYELTPNHNNVQFKNKNKEIYNPYSFVWNNGRHYIIVTPENSTDVKHLRVDRINSVTLVKDRNDATKYESREPIPDSLKPYYPKHSKKSSHKNEFNATKYVNEHPLLMSNFDNEIYVDAVLECNTNALSIILDAFGVSVEVAPSTLEHEMSLDRKKNAHEYVFVHIRNVLYTNILLFCLQKQANVTDSIPNITPIYPPRLITDVKNGLRKAITFDTNIEKQLSNLDHPFISNKKLSN